MCFSSSNFSKIQQKLFENEVSRSMSQKTSQISIFRWLWPPKTFPKPFQTASQLALPKNMQCFIDFCALFLLFSMSDFLGIIIFLWRKSLFLKVSLKTCFCNRPSFLHRKTYQKRFKNDVRNLQKSTSKIDCFSASIFWGFGLVLGASWASKLDSKSPFRPRQN